MVHLFTGLFGRSSREISWLLPRFPDCETAAAPFNRSAEGRHICIEDDSSELHSVILNLVIYIKYPPLDKPVVTK